MEKSEYNKSYIIGYLYFPFYGGTLFFDLLEVEEISSGEISITFMIDVIDHKHTIPFYENSSGGHRHIAHILYSNNYRKGFESAKISFRPDGLSNFHFTDVIET